MTKRVGFSEQCMTGLRDKEHSLLRFRVLSFENFNTSKEDVLSFYLFPSLAFHALNGPSSIGVGARV